MLLKLKVRKKRKKQILLKKRLESAIKKYIDKLHHRGMFESAACLTTCAQIDNKLSQITSISRKKEAMKDQIIIRVLGLSWDDWHHPWSAEGHEFTGEELAEHIKKLMKRDKKRKICSKATVDTPSRNKLTVLGTISPDIIRLDEKKTAEEGKLIEAAEVLKNN